MAHKLLSNLLERFTKPLIGLGAVSVSATLAACYGPPPHYADGKTPDQSIEEYCELILQNGCKDEKGFFPEACGLQCRNLRLKNCEDPSVAVPECCPDMSENERIQKGCPKEKAQEETPQPEVPSGT